MKAQTLFQQRIDELVEFAEYDPELLESIKWLDSVAQKENKTFYEKCYEVLLKHDANSRAREWMNKR